MSSTTSTPATSNSTTTADSNGSPTVTPEVTTEQTPVTTFPSATTEGGIQTPEVPVGGKIELPAALAGLAKRYPLESEPTGEYADQTVAELIDGATEGFEKSVHRSLTAKGYMTLDSGIVTLLLNASRLDLELSYLSGENATALSSKVSTDKGKVTEDQQVYIGGWLYNTSVYKQNDKQTGTEQYKVQMTPEQFSDYALSGADTAMNDLGKLSELINTADSTAVGMDADGNCVILAQGIDADLMLTLIGSDSALADAVSPESFAEMEVAVVIGVDGNVDEIYFSLPLRLITEQGGIRFSANGVLEMTLTVDTPASVTIGAPASGASYPQISIEEAYAKNDSWLNW
ncbi:MAG: hypothetical protein IJX47_03145 [Clostridia bacterium]|nr:hypothetical protein [Clostridia bacterium]